MPVYQMMSLLLTAIPAHHFLKPLNGFSHIFCEINRHIFLYKIPFSVNLLIIFSVKFPLPILCTVRFWHREGCRRVQDHRNTASEAHTEYPNIPHNEESLYPDSIPQQDILHGKDVRLFRYTHCSRMSPYIRIQYSEVHILNQPYITSKFFL